METEKSIAASIYKQLVSKYGSPLTILKLKQFLASNNDLPEKEVDEMLIKLDANSDGELSLEEFSQGYIFTEKLATRLTTLRQNWSQIDHGSQVTENIQTRIFLSHKRSTGQGIAGRLFEGLRNDFQIFLDSEAKFKIHNLKQIVENTDVFVFILSSGILLSPWCLQELQSAVDNKKKIVVVRDLLYNLPDVLPPQWQPFENVLCHNQLIWMAEYNLQCIESLNSEIGPSDKMIVKAAKYLSEHVERIRNSGILKLTRTLTPGTFPAILWIIQSNTFSTSTSLVRECLKSFLQNQEVETVWQSIESLRLAHIKEIDAIDYEISDKDIFTWKPNLDFSEHGLHDISVKLRKMKLDSVKKVRSFFSSNFGSCISSIHFEKPIANEVLLAAKNIATPSVKNFSSSSAQLDIPGLPSLTEPAVTGIPPPPPGLSPPPPPALGGPPPPNGPSAPVSDIRTSNNNQLSSSTSPVPQDPEWMILTNEILIKIAPFLANANTILIGVCSISDDGLVALLKHCTKLKKLEIHKAPQLGSAVKTVAEYCPEIAEAVLPDNTEINGSIFGHLVENCKHLKKIHGIPVDTSLKQVDFGDNWNLISDGALEWFSQYPFQNLEELNFANCDVTQHFEQALKNRGNLQTLVLAGAHNVTNKTVETVTAHCKKLKNLNLAGCAALGSNALQLIANNLPYLVSINISETDVQDSAVVALFSQCPYLEEINLSDCYKITDAAFTEISKRSQTLRKLILNQCFLLTDVSLLALATAKIPLTHLEISGCVLVTTEGICAILQTFALTHLNISACSKIKQFKEQHGTLKYLDASRAYGLNNAFPIAQNTQLEFLDLSDCRSFPASDIPLITDACHKTLKDFRLVRNFFFSDAELLRVVQKTHELTHANFTQCGLKKDSLTYLGFECRKLKSLNFQDCVNVSNAALEQLKYLHELEDLTLAGFVTQDNGILNIAERLPSLVKLDIAGGAFSDKYMDRFAERLQKLRDLNITGCAITDQGLEYLAAIKTLQVLNLTNCKNITDKGLYNVTLGCSALKELTMDGCQKLGEECLTAIAQNCYNLKKLSLAELRQLSDDAFRPLALFGEYLVDLNIRDCQGITDAVFLAIAPTLFNLEGINLGGCEQLTDKSISVFGETSRKLVNLYLGNCKFMTDKSLQHFAKNNARIKQLYLSGCVKITYKGIQAITEKNPKIELIDLSFCSSTTDRTLQWIGKKCPRLKNLVLASVRMSARELDTGLANLAAGCKLLETVIVSETNLQDKGLESLVTGNPHLQMITLNRCNLLTDASFQYLAQCKFLVLLMMDNTAVTDEGVKQLGDGACTVLRDLSVEGTSVTKQTLLDMTRKLPFLRVF